MSELIGLLSPGEMGATVGTSMLASGYEVGWHSADRSEATRSRAQSFTAFPDASVLFDRAQGIVSVCPPSIALSQARWVADSSFAGIYVDANAVSPATASQIADLFGERYVDGGIVGPPATISGSTRLFLCGQRASDVALWFQGGLIEAITLTGSNTSASSLKMAYAAYTKGLSALLLGVNAFARANGVQSALRDEWARSQPELLERSERAARGTSRKAWRFVGEMDEIAESFIGVGLPSGFHSAAAEVYASMSSLKDEPPADLDLVLSTILEKRKT